MEKNIFEKLFVGDMVYLPFPFKDADAEKNRWAFVLADKGDNALVLYCTTNPAWPGAVRLGQVADKMVANLVPYRWEEVSKERFITAKGIVKLQAPCPGLGDMVLKAIKREVLSGRYGEHTQEVVEAIRYFAERGKKQHEKAAKKAARR